MKKSGESSSFKPSLPERIGSAWPYLLAVVLAAALIPFSLWLAGNGVGAAILVLGLQMGNSMMVFPALLIAASFLCLTLAIGLMVSLFRFGSMFRERRYQVAIGPVCLAEAVVRVETSDAAGDPITVASGQRGVLFGPNLNSEVTLRLIGRSQIGKGEEGSAELCFPRDAQRPTGLSLGTEFELLDFRHRLLGRGVVSRLRFPPKS